MHPHDDLPAIDERLALPEAGYEIFDGVVTFVVPSDPPHGTAHHTVSVLIGAHVHPDFTVAIDLLTRTSKIDDIAPDVSVFPRGPDPITGGRQLEHLAWEIVSTTRMSWASTRARKLVGRGVRRVFAIDVEHARVTEWSHELDTWSVLELSGVIDDPVFAVQLPVNALLRAFADDDVARALTAKGNRWMVETIARERDEGRDEGREQGREQGRQEGREEGRQEGRDKGRIEALIAILEARGFTVQGEQRDRMFSQRARLDDWLARVATCAGVDELIGD